MSYELYNNKICVDGSQLIGELISRNTYINLSKRNHINVLRRGGNGRSALIEFDSIRPDIKEQLVIKLGDPYKVIHPNNVEKHYELDFKAEHFFMNYTLDNGSSLPEQNIKQYTTEASLLNTVKTIINNRMALRKTLGGSTRGVWDKIVELVADLPKHRYPHALPTNVRRFRDKFNEFHKDGYESLIHKNFANSNAEKINEDAKLWILSRWADQVNRCATILQLHNEYNELADLNGWKRLKDKESLNKYLNQEHIKSLWYGHRFGELKSKEKYNYQHTTALPSMRDSLWYGDGTKLNYYYLDQDGSIKTCQVYEVMDAYSEVLLGHFVSKTEDYEAQYFSFKRAIQNSGYRPYQIGVDNQGGHKKLTTGNFFSKITRLSLKTQPYNGKSKTIESAFGRFQSQFLAQDWFFTGQNVTAKKVSSKANMEFILANKSNLKTLEEIKQIYAARREEWNNAKHYATGIPRNEMYRNSVNQKTPQVTILDMVEMFWIEREQPITVTPYGITFKEKNVEYQYTVYDENRMPDINWLRKNVDKKLYVKFDPEDMSLIHLFEKDALGLRFYTQAETKVVIHRGKQEQEDWESEWITKVNNANKEARLSTYNEMESILESFGATPEQQGLNRPKVSGLETRKKAKANPSKIGEYQKAESNLVLIRLDGTEEEVDPYDMM